MNGSMMENVFPLPGVPTTHVPLKGLLMFAEFALVVVPHRDIHAVLVLHQFLALLEALVLKIEPVFHQPVLDELRDVVQGDMHEYHAHERSGHVQDNVHGQRVQLHPHRFVEQPYGEDKQRKTRCQGHDDLPLGVELQMLLVSRTDAGDADQQDGGQLAVHQMSIAVYHPSFDAAMYVRNNSSPITE